MLTKSKLTSLRNKKKETILKKDSTPQKPPHELIEQEAELRRQNEEDRALIDDKIVLPLKEWLPRKKLQKEKRSFPG